MSLATSAPSEARDLRDHPWFPVVAAVVLLVLIGLAVTRVVRHDVVAGWQVLATCPTTDGAVVASTSSTPDTTACTAPPTDSADARGWPVVATVLPPSAGQQPDVTQVRVDKAHRTVVLDYRPGGAASDSPRIVFVEVPPSALPATPVTVTSSPRP